MALDTQRFPEASAAAYHDAALALWRGPVADGLLLPDAPAFEDALAGARTRLARQARGRTRSQRRGLRGAR